MRTVLALLLEVCMLLSTGCSTDVTPSEEAAALQTLLDDAELIEVDEEHALLSVFAVSPQEAFIAGGGVGPQSGVVYRMNGEQINRENTPVGAALWWIWGDTSGQLWACGDRGRILRRLPSGVWQTESTPLDDDTILYGLWGDGSGSMWAVGGSYRRLGEQNIVLTSNGNGSWHRLNIIEPPDAFTFFKVWGHEPTWIVGDLGWILRISEDEQTYTQTPEKQVLFTVHGNGEDVLAVGGQTMGQMYGLQRTNVIRQHVSGVASINGIYVRADGWRIAAGEGGHVLASTHQSDWVRGTLFPQALSQRTIHSVSSTNRTLFVGGDMRRMNRGFIVRSSGFEDQEAGMR